MKVSFKVKTTFVHQKAIIPTFKTTFLLQNNLCEFKNKHTQIQKIILNS